MPTLIEKLEAAGEGSRELDTRIHALLEDRDLRQDEFGRLLGRSREAPHDECIMAYPNFSPDTAIPCYTTSLDAALTLVPEGYRLELYQSANGEWWDADLSPLGYDVDHEDGWSNGDGKADPALALCIAALKAREAMEKVA